MSTESDCVYSDRSQDGRHLCSLPMRPCMGEGPKVTRETAQAPSLWGSCWMAHPVGFLVEGAGNQNVIPLTSLNPQPFRVQGLEFEPLRMQGTSGCARTRLSLSSSSLSLSLSLSRAFSLSRARALSLSLSLTHTLSLVRIARCTCGHGGVRDDGP